ncbi:MAG: glycosyltransferase family 2 protein [Bacteroidota bacterium]|nr:glycosyltransferase family 2 protein [Bacteroidota bacterium]
MLISVIVPCYNYACFLSEALESILNQTYSKWECIIVDDGSTDNTKEVAERFIARDSRFRYIFQQNKGLPASRNTGLKEAKGEFIQLLDADDLISTEKFQTQIKAFINNPNADIVYSNYKAFNNDDPDNLFVYTERDTLIGNPLDDYIYNFGTKMITPMHVFLFRILCFKRWGFFSESFKNYEDWDLYVRFAINKPVYIHTPGDMALYRRHGSGICADSEKFLWWKVRVIKHHMNNKDLSLVHRRFLRNLIHKRIGESAFNDIKNHTLLKGLKKLLIASWYSGNPFYYFYHGLYWYKKG